MSRTPSSIRTRSDRGVAVSERDLARIRLMGRWHSLTAEHIARAEQDPALWSPAYASAQTPEARTQFERAVEAVKRRLRTLKAIESDPGIGIGPLVGTALSPTGRTVYYATRIGGRTAGLPWGLRDRINPMLSPHAGMAADIGMALEAKGYRVLAEREIATGIDRHGDEITAPLTSEHTTQGGRMTGKRPDVVILHPNGTSYIAIEIERDTDRAISVYEQKLAAYESNTAVKAVWYMCASDTTARRVGKAADRVLGRSGFPLRIATPSLVDGYHSLDMDRLPEKLRADLGKVR